MEKIIIVTLSLLCVLSMTAFAASKSVSQTPQQGHRQRLTQMQIIVEAIALSDLAKAKKGAMDLQEMVNKDAQIMPDSDIKNKTQSLLSSIHVFNEALDKKSHLTIIESFSNILGSCYACHIKIRDIKK